MFWKVLGGVVAVWLLFVLLGVLLKGLFWLATVAVIAGGVYLLLKFLGDGSDAPAGRRR